jgi:hypothetical protein
VRRSEMAEHTDHKIYKTKELPGVALTVLSP